MQSPAVSTDTASLSPDTVDVEGQDAKRRRVTQACVQCKKIHRSCDAGVPCSRCIERGLGHECCYGDRRKRGRKALAGDEFSVSSPSVSSSLNADSNVSSVGAASAYDSPATDKASAHVSSPVSRSSPDVGSSFVSVMARPLASLIVRPAPTRPKEVLPNLSPLELFCQPVKQNGSSASMQQSVTDCVRSMLLKVLPVDQASELLSRAIAIVSSRAAAGCAALSEAQPNRSIDAERNAMLDCLKNLFVPACVFDAKGSIVALNTALVDTCMVPTHSPFVSLLDARSQVLLLEHWLDLLATCEKSQFHTKVALKTMQGIHEFVMSCKVVRGLGGAPECAFAIFSPL